jgi:transposase
MLSGWFRPRASSGLDIDMSPAYTKALRESLGNAAIVYGKYHVVSQVSEAVEAVRRTEVRQDAQAREQLEKTCWLWRKNPENWTDREAARWDQLKGKPLADALRVGEYSQAYRVLGGEGWKRHHNNATTMRAEKA